MPNPMPVLWAFLVLLLSVTTATITVAQPNFSRVVTGATTVDRANSNGAAWIDFDGDDDLDLFVANIGGSPNFLYENDGTGLLERVLVGPVGTDVRSSRGLCWADFDNSGAVDVFVTGSTGAPMLYRNVDGGDLQPVNILTTFGTADLRGWACAWGDFDADGFVDLVISHPAGFVGSPSTSNHLFRNNRDGTFTRVSDGPVTAGLAPYTVPTFSDYDLDGDLDLFIGSGPANGVPGPDFLYRNTLVESGTAVYERITEGPLATTNRDGQVINWIDYDNDRDLDVYVTNWGGTSGGMRDELFRNDDGTLVTIADGAIVRDKQVSLANLWADFDNDGDLDVFVTDGSGSGSNRLYDNNGDGTFRRLVTGPAVNDRAVSWGATAGDMDADGDLDLYVANINLGSQNNTPNFLYRNDLDNGNHWIRLKLTGVASNRSGIGAKVHAKAEIGGMPVWQFREVSSQNSFNGHNSLFVHVGLGDATRVDSLVIDWPSGHTDVFTAIEPDRFISVIEGESPTVVASERGVELLNDVNFEENYPNPFTGSTTITFVLPGAASVLLEIVDLLGRVVATPVDDTRTAGRHRIEVSTDKLSSGTYLLRLSAAGRLKTRSMTISR